MEQPLEDGTTETQNSDPVLWSLVSEISQGLQISFASIKAAISSLLGGDIFWDHAAQHEFMQTIDKSIDDISELTAVMTMAMRAESRSLLIYREPNDLQEILSQAKDLVQKGNPDAVIQLPSQALMRLAFVDFEHLRTAFRLLFEILISVQPNSAAPILVSVQEKVDEWQIVIGGKFPPIAYDIIHWLQHQSTDLSLLPVNLRSETRLKILVSCQLLALQMIAITISSGPVEGETALVIHIPFAM